MSQEPLPTDDQWRFLFDEEELTKRRAEAELQYGELSSAQVSFLRKKAKTDTFFLAQALGYDLSHVLDLHRPAIGRGSIAHHGHAEGATYGQGPCASRLGFRKPGLVNPFRASLLFLPHLGTPRSAAE